MARVGVFLLFLSFLELIHRTSGVNIVSSSSDVEVNEFETATLRCDYILEKDTKARLEWKMIKGKHISFVYFDGALVDKYKDRATMSGSSIVLRRVTRADTATYRCEVTATKDTRIFAEVSFKLIVLVPPAIPTCKVPSSAMSGSEVKLVCEETEGSPPSEYTWYKDNRVLLETPAKDSTANNVSYVVNRKTGILMFNPVRKSNSGSYFCEAHNKVGRSQRCSVKFMQIKRRSTTSNGANRTNTPAATEDFKHTKSFVI
ncbi:junctional adhesion molecule 2A isoform X2 [Pristis pectinata]|uniref:junctional adhesion molecule 2A isoform X2 n=1 Tax=Pristis pectinata TaxID=685728 RepID=UPI00223D51C1|nr:junctional adhesion molecule 2A isoform X2 [Pristis pectinata]